jgi:hypothetical protein
VQNRKDFKEKTIKVKTLEKEINNRKKEMDKLKEQLDKKHEVQKSEGEAANDVIDEEEFAILKELKEHKKIHKQNYEEYRNLKGELLVIKQNIDQLKQKLILSYDDWYDKTYGAYLDSSMQGSLKAIQIVLS